MTVLLLLTLLEGTAARAAVSGVSGVCLRLGNPRWLLSRKALISSPEAWYLQLRSQPEYSELSNLRTANNDPDDGKSCFR